MAEPLAQPSPLAPADPYAGQSVGEILAGTWPGQLVTGAWRAYQHAVEPARVYFAGEEQTPEQTRHMLGQAAGGTAELMLNSPGTSEVGAVLTAGARRPSALMLAPGMGERGIAPIVEQAEGKPGLISQRNPTGARRTEDPLQGEPLKIGLDSLKSDPKSFATTMQLLRGPGYPLPRGLLTGHDEHDVQAFMQHLKDNLLFIHDSLPAEIRDRSKLWYDGANKIANERARYFGLPEESVAGVYAALSPQKDWFMNVSLGDRVMGIYHWQGGDGTLFNSHMLDALNARFPGKYDAEKQLLMNQPLRAIEDPWLKGMWIRAYDEAARTENPMRAAHYIVTAEGRFAGLKMNKDGVTPSGTSWGSFDQIEGAVQSIESGGDRRIISDAMGQKHKVRNFYNNIYDPWSRRGDVTIDTHAVGAGMFMPVAGGDVAVMHNLGTSPAAGGWGSFGTRGAPSSVVTGVDGTYGIFADAYRQAAAERGILPREMQSITWEGIRSLFPGEEKDAALKALVAQLWQSGMRPEEIRQQIVRAGGGFRPPDWHGR